MTFAALTCPQCAGPLPHQALWRMIQCPYCGTSVTKHDNLVQRAWFKESLQQVNAAAEHAADALAELAASGSRVVSVENQRYRILAPLGGGVDSEVFLAQRISPFPERVTLKLARTTTPAGALARKATILQALQQIAIPGASYFSQRLPQVVSVGAATDCFAASPGAEALVLRHPVGFWGSMADVLRYQPDGIDPRHAVWIWRRMLEVLAYIHDAGWMHGDILPEHMLVQPKDHGILLIGWSRARKAAAQDQARDLQQTAWSLRCLLARQADLANRDQAPLPGSHIPRDFAICLTNASENRDWCQQLGAAGLLQEVGRAARAAFGPAKFIHFHPDPRSTPI